jgi:uncharacterized protein YjiK
MMISKREKILFSSVTMILLLTLIFWADLRTLAGIKAEPEEISGRKNMKKDKKSKAEESTGSFSEVIILKKWELPPDLKEVSGIAYMDDQRFACIQDEEGTIFIFNTALGRIERRIVFAGSGDFEDITIKNSKAYVVRADGRIFEVDMTEERNSSKEFSTRLTVKQNVEGICYDKRNDRLLLAIKDDEPGNPGYKGLYAFDLSTETFIKEPVFKIRMEDEIFPKAREKKNKSMMPSAIAIHPGTNELYITDGPRSHLLIMDDTGKPKKLLQLGKDFAQPEGITFSPAGELFISNEGSKRAGNILKVKLR